MNDVLKDTLSAQMSASVFFNEEATLCINGTDFTISGFFEKTDNRHDEIGHVSRLSTSHRFITAVDIDSSDANTRNATLNGIKVKTISKDLNGLTVIHLL